MMKRLMFINILLTALCLGSFTLSAHAKKMYKWVDANGKVFFSDQVPPEKATLKHQELDKNAQVVKVNEGAKTKEQLDMEKRILLLKKEQEQTIIRQKAQDKKLLSNFLSVDAMEASYKQRDASFNQQQADLEQKIKEFETELTDLHKEAADYEIKNTKIPATLLKQISDQQNNIAKAKADIKDLQDKKLLAKQDYENDRARYLLLTQPDPAGKSENTPGIFNCENSVQCDKAWTVAKEFVKVNTSTKIIAETDTALLSEDPDTPAVLSLSVTKLLLEGSYNPVLFLTIRCSDKGLCTSAKEEEIKQRFNDYIKAKL